MPKEDDGKVLSELSTESVERNTPPSSKPNRIIERMNPKTNSSSLFLNQVIEDIHAREVKRPKKGELSKPRFRAREARWREKSSQINSILDVEILKMRGILNGSVKEQILVDTGAKSNVIRKEMVQKLGLMDQITPTDIALTAANDSSLKVLGKVKVASEWDKGKNGNHGLEVFNYALHQSQVDSIYSISDYSYSAPEVSPTIDSDSFIIDFIVVEKLSVPVILGMKGIHQMKMKIDFEDETIIVNNKGYQFINTKRIAPLQSTKETKVPAQSISFIEIEGDLREAVYSIEDANQLPISVIESGFTAKEGKNIFKVWIRNTHKEDIIIPKYATVAVANNPNPIIEKKEEENIQVIIDGEARTIAAISEKCADKPKMVKDHQERVNMIENEARIQRDKLVVGKNISNKERERLFELVKKEEAIFKEKLTEEIRSNQLPKYHMKLKDDAISHIAAMGRMSPDKEEILEKEIADLLERGLIEFSDGTWRARVALVKKKDGKWRRCIDYRVLNEMTIADSYPMVRIDETLDQLGKAKYFSKLDMVEGYYQMPFHESSKPYTGFATRSEFYQWR